jgi:hypothetical protein
MARRSYAPGAAPKRKSAPRRKRQTPKVTAPRGLTEDQIHTAVVHHLNLRGVAGLVFWHTPNGGLRSKSEAAKLARMGVLAGVPDLMFIYRGKTYGLELKTETGRISSAQRAVLTAMEQAGVATAVSKGLDAALDQLEAWGLIAPDLFGKQAA